MIKIRDFITGDIHRDSAETFSDTFLVIMGLPLIGAACITYNTARGIFCLGKRIEDKIKTNKAIAEAEPITVDTVLKAQDEMNQTAKEIVEPGINKPKRLILERNPKEM